MSCVLNQIYMHVFSQVLDNLPHDLIYSENQVSPWMEVWVEKQLDGYLVLCWLFTAFMYCLLHHDFRERERGRERSWKNWCEIAPFKNDVMFGMSHQVYIENYWLIFCPKNSMMGNPFIFITESSWWNFHSVSTINLQLLLMHRNDNLEDDVISSSL